MEGLSGVRVGDLPRGNGTNAKTDRAGEGDLVRAQEGEPSQVEGILQIRTNRNEQTYYTLVERHAIGARACISERVHDPEQGHRTNATKNSGH